MSSKSFKKITSSTPLREIIRLVDHDFDVTIDEQDAQELKDAHRRGALTWIAGEKITNTASGGNIASITPGKVRGKNGATYSAREWRNL